MDLKDAADVRSLAMQAMSSDELNKYSKYSELLFGEDTEHTDNELVFNIKKGPRANEYRKKWSDKEEKEIERLVDLKTFRKQPGASVARNVRAQSKKQGDVLNRQLRILKRL